MNSGLKPACKLAKSLTNTSSKVNKPKIYNEATQNSYWMRLAKSNNPTVLKIDLNTGSGIRLVRKLAKFLTETSNKVHESKTCDEAIGNLIYGNR